MKLTIYRKVMIGFGVIILLMFVASAFGLLELSHISETTRSVLTVDVQAIDLAKQMRTILYEEERYAQKYLISQDTTYHVIFADNNRIFNRFLDSLAGMLPDERDRQLIERIGRRHDWHFTAVSEADPYNPAGTEKARTDTVDAMHRSLDALITTKQRTVRATVDDIDTATQRSFRVALIIAATTLLAAIATAFIIARTITRPLRTLVAGTKEIAGGSFTRIRVNSKDETADLAAAFNSMSASLDALNRFRAEMMQHISHELRMPLQTIHSVYYLLTEQKAGPVTEQQRKLLDNMMESVDKIAKFSNQFLDLSKVEAGMMEYNLVSADLAKVIRPAVSEAEALAARKQITLSFLPFPAPEVVVDAEKCSQIASNLINNALKYTDEGGTVEVIVGPSPRGVHLTVRDTGAGIPAAELPKVFTKFYRASSAVQERKKGTGIGLAFVKALVEGQGGKVSASSKPGVGSTFTVEFPTARAAGRKKAS
ncbi:MAG: ATP-binding protein [Bacteroidota bacterium]